MNIFADGSIFLQSPDKDFEYEELLKNIIGTIYRTKFCNMCGTCISICMSKAIYKKDNHIEILPDLCKQCRQCLTHCSLYPNIKNLFEKLKF